jgi:hypothetical protein
MSERPTDEQLLAWRDKLGGPSVGVVTELLVLRARVAQLEVVHRELAQICWEGGSLDGGKLQDLLVKHGVLVEATVEKPCSEYCNCEYYDAVFPTTCYRLKDAPQ